MELAMRGKSHPEILDAIFTQVGEFGVADSGRITFSCSDVRKTGTVYAFVFHDLSGDRSIWYLGKAGKGIRARLGQHLGGMHLGSTETQEAANLIREHLGRGGAMTIWTKAAQEIELFGELVTLEDAEETALLALLDPKPIRNKLKVGSPSKLAPLP